MPPFFFNFVKNKTMYKLKDEYKGVTVNKTGRMIILDNVKSDEVELLGVEYFFTKAKKNKEVALKPNPKRTKEK